MSKTNEASPFRILREAKDLLIPEPGAQTPLTAHSP
jgi:hypothetical protein